MIKILETPITYDKDYNAMNIDAWVYKNPTEDEIYEISKTEHYNIIRIIIDNKDYYAASGYYFNHNSMMKCLAAGGYKINSIGNYVIDIKADNICTGWYGRNDQKKAYKLLKPFIPEMFKVGLLTEETTIDTTIDEDMIIINLDGTLERPYLKDVLKD